MQTAPSPSARRVGWFGLAGLVVAAVGLGPSVIARVGPDVAGASPVGASPVGASTSTTASTAVAGAVAPDTTTTAAAPTTTTSTAAATTTTTAAAPVAPAPAVPSTTTTTAAAARTANATPSTTQLAQVEAIADSSGFDWRGAGVVIHVAFNPTDCCHWGIYDYRDNSLWIGPTAFGNPTRLRYVVLHELGHAFQWDSGHLDRMEADMAPWGVSGEAALEYSADCIATVEGAQMDNYWACPAAAQTVVRLRLSGDWS